MNARFIFANSPPRRGFVNPSFCFHPRVTLLEDRTAPSGVPASWMTRGAGGGGSLFSPQISPHDASNMYISSDMGQLFRTNDTGVSWSTVDFREIQGFHQTSVQFTNDPNILYSIDYSSIEGTDYQRPTKSTDGGINWTPLAVDPTDNGAYYIHADPSNSNRLILSNYNQIYYSSNGGGSWSTVYTAPAGSDGVIVGGAFWDGTKIYLGTSLGILSSSNGGSSFAILPLSGIPSGQSIFSFTAAKNGSTTRFVVTTRDTGSIWPGAQGYDQYGAGGIYTHDVGATSWTARSIPGSAWAFYAGMAQNDINVMYVAGGSDNFAPTVYKSTNGGATWSDVFRTTNNQNIQTGWSGDGGDRGWGYGELALGFEVNPVNPNHVVITDFGFAHVSTDGGATWKAAYVNPGDLNAANQSTPTGKEYRDSGLDNTTAWQIAWLGQSNVFIANTDVRGQISYEGGTSFGFDYTGHSRNTMYRVARAANGTTYAAVASVHDLYNSRYLTDASMDGGNGAILFSTNDGRTWQTLKDFGKIMSWVAIDPTNPNRLYAAMAHSTQGGIYVTDNLSAGAAATWTKLAIPPRTEGHAFNINVLNDGTLVVSYSGRINTSGAFTASAGVFVSTNGGQTWTDRSDNGMKYWMKDVVIDPHDATQNTWYAGVYSGWGGPPNGLGGLYKTTNRGVSWTRILNSDRVGSATFNPSDPNEMFVTTETAGLWYSNTIRGASPTFSQVASYPFRQPERVFFNPNNANEIWVTSFGGGVKVGTTASAGTLQIRKGVTSVDESAGTAVFQVTRTGGYTGAVTLQYTTSNGTATAPGDYTTTSGTLTWADGSSRSMRIVVPIIDDTLPEGDETFFVTISNPTGGATLGATTKGTVTILANDGGGRWIDLTSSPSADLGEPTAPLASDAGLLAVEAPTRSSGDSLRIASPVYLAPAESVTLAPVAEPAISTMLDLAVWNIGAEDLRQVDTPTVVVPSAVVHSTRPDPLDLDATLGILDGVFVG